MSDRMMLPVLSAGAEHLVMGYLMRRNILTYKAPERNEGYDLICIHPDPRHRLRKGERGQIRVQVKSRFATDAYRGFPIKAKSLNAFDYLIVVFQNIGRFGNKHDGSEGEEPVEFYTLDRTFIKRHHIATTSWEKVVLAPHMKRIQKYRDEAGFERIAQALGVSRTLKVGV